MLCMATAITPGWTSPGAAPRPEGSAGMRCLLAAPPPCSLRTGPRPDPSACSTRFICAVHMVSSCLRYLPFPLM